MCLQAREISLEDAQRQQLAVRPRSLQQLPRIAEAAILLAGARQGHHAPVQLTAAGRRPAVAAGAAGQAWWLDGGFRAAW